MPSKRKLLQQEKKAKKRKRKLEEMARNSKKNKYHDMAQNKILGDRDKRNYEEWYGSLEEEEKERFVRPKAGPTRDDYAALKIYITKKESRSYYSPNYQNRF